MSNIIIYIIVEHLRKLFKFQIYSWAPGWIELAPGHTFNNYYYPCRITFTEPLEFYSSIFASCD